MIKDEIWTRFERLREQGILSDVDLEFTRFIEEKSRKQVDNVLLAACLTSYSYRQGNVCLLLEDVAGSYLFEEAEEGTNMKGPERSAWLDDLNASDAIGSPGDFKPLILDQSNRLYLHKLWKYERSLAEDIIKRSEAKDYEIDWEQLKQSMTRLFGASSGDEPDWQQVAAVTAVLNRFTIISGGPGTGKTTTVVRLLGLLLEQFQESEFPSIALAAPTGKAAARLKDSILSIKTSLPVEPEVRDAIPNETMTLHQLLGARRHSSTFRHNRDNPLPYELVIVDEASMVDQALMSKLMDALLDDTRLILLGDKDQLASVEAGSVMGDLCAIEKNSLSHKFANSLSKIGVDLPERYVSDEPQLLTDHIILLTKSYRFEGDSGIAKLAGAINRGDDAEVLNTLKSEEYPEVRFALDSPEGHLGNILETIVSSHVEGIINAPTPEDAFDVFSRFKILAAHRRGPRGVEQLNQGIERMLQQKGIISGYQNWYPGKPVIINENDYTLGLHNGDTGVCLMDGNGQLKIYIEQDGELEPLNPSRLPDHNLAYALTVHKSQGSEFDRVMVVLPDHISRIVTRELLYTAVTRARNEVIIAGRSNILSKGVQSRLKRTSGLQDQLWTD